MDKILPKMENIFFKLFILVLKGMLRTIYFPEKKQKELIFFFPILKPKSLIGVFSQLTTFLYRLFLIESISKDLDFLLVLLKVKELFRIFRFVSVLISLHSEENFFFFLKCNGIQLINLPSSPTTFFVIV